MTKHELREHRHLLAQIRHIDGQITEWRTRAERCTRATDKPPVYGGNNDPYPYIFDKISELETEQAEKISKLKSIRAAMTVLDEREAQLIRAYYVEGKSWGTVAQNMGYSWRQTMRIHGYALRKMAHNGT
jgi:DNA-directed RNA polymerase specialized sigma subunit